MGTAMKMGVAASVMTLGLLTGCEEEPEGYDAYADDYASDFTEADETDAAYILPPEDDGDPSYSGGSSSFWPMKLTRIGYPNHNDWKRDLCINDRTPGTSASWHSGYFTFDPSENDYRYWKYFGQWSVSSHTWNKDGVCESRQSGYTLFHDGCSQVYPSVYGTKTVQKGPWAGWDPGRNKALFHGACVLHDMCYKATSNNKQHCEDIARDAMYEICDRSYYKYSPEWALCKDDAWRSWGVLSTNVGSQSNYDEFFVPGMPYSDYDVCPAGEHYDPVTWQCE